MSAEDTNVTPAAFTKAADHTRAALIAYNLARERCDEAQRELEALSCGEKFTYEVPGPYAEESDDVYVIEEECPRPNGHIGDHGASNDAGDETLAYAQARQHFQETARLAGRERATWEDAEEILDALRCNQGPAEEWPCVLRRGHSGDHEHPDELHLVL